MADFNPATMVDVTRPAVSLQAAFTGSISASTGILSVTAYTSGQITSQMTLTTSGFDAVVVTDKLTPQAGEIERWQTYRIFAGVVGSVTNGVLTVASVWRGSMATLGTLKYLFLTSYASGGRLLSAVSVDGSGIGTYNLSSSSTLNVSSRRMLVQYLAASSQAITNAAFSGVWEWEPVSPVSPTVDQSAAVEHIGLAVAPSGKGVYFPAGRYLGITAMSGVDVYGQASTGASRTILQAKYDHLMTQQLNAKSLTDCRLEGLLPGKTKFVNGCYFWFPDKTASFTGSISGTTLTVSSVASGFLHVGAAVTGSGVTPCTITAFVSGAAGGVGAYTVSVSQTAAETSMATAIPPAAGAAWNYYLGDSLAVAADYGVTDNIFDLPGWYIPVWVLNPQNALVSGNEFLYRDNGFNSHTIRIDASDGAAKKIEATHNKLHMTCITGILAGSNRYAPIRNLVVDWNEVHRNTEEALAIDGFGNNAGLCPCICNGRLTTLTNDTDGRLVVSLAQFIYNTGSATALSPVSVRNLDLTGYVSDDVFTTTAAHNGYVAPGSTLKGVGVPPGTVITEVVSRTGIGSSGNTYRLNKAFTLGSVGSPATVKMADWKKFYFIFSEGTGADGAIVEIYDYDATANTLTLDMFRDASLFTTGDDTWAGVHAGFFGGSCSHNRVSGDSKSGQNANATYSVGISLYHNVFNFDAGHNEIAGVNEGISVTGGHMLSAYHVLAYHNNLHDNVVACAQSGKPGVAVKTQYFGIPQRGNRVSNNNCIQSNVILEGAADTMCDGNILAGDNAKVIRTFPTPVMPATDI
jgi:hypothetical protein